ncbi:MAG: hypothetical protein KAX55_09755 [Propionivibrio sp.]|nr:hypothetical protein [Propionivibrio sp.]
MKRTAWTIELGFAICVHFNDEDQIIGYDVYLPGEAAPLNRKTLESWLAVVAVMKDHLEEERQVAMQEDNDVIKRTPTRKLK